MYILDICGVYFLFHYLAVNIVRIYIIIYVYIYIYIYNIREQFMLKKEDADKCVF